MGRLQKPAERRQGHRPGLALVPIVGRSAEKVPPPPDGASLESRKLWREFWASPMAQLVQPVDLGSLRHLFRLYEERDRAYRAYHRKPYVQGSKRQPVVNPILRHARVFEGEIRRLEDRFGISPRARLALGIPTGPQTALEDLNRELYDDDGD